MSACLKCGQVEITIEIRFINDTEILYLTCIRNRSRHSDSSEVRMAERRRFRRIGFSGARYRPKRWVHVDHATHTL